MKFFENLLSNSRSLEKHKFDPKFLYPIPERQGKKFIFKIIFKEKQTLYYFDFNLQNFRVFNFVKTFIHHI